jgi:hypothetical protein
MRVLTAVATFSDGLCLEPALYCASPQWDSLCWRLGNVEMSDSANSSRPMCMSLTDENSNELVCVGYFFHPILFLSCLLSPQGDAALQTKTVQPRKTCHSSSSISRPNYFGNLDTTQHQSV